MNMFGILDCPVSIGRRQSSNMEKCNGSSSFGLQDSVQLSESVAVGVSPPPAVHMCVYM